MHFLITKFTYKFYKKHIFEEPDLKINFNMVGFVIPTLSRKAYLSKHVVSCLTKKLQFVL